MPESGWQRTLRNRLKSSSIRRAFWAVARKKSLALRRQEEDFYRKLLFGFRPGDTIFDIGANEGAKADIFLKLGARVVALEPDSACQTILRDRFLRYRVRPGKITLVSSAVSDKRGTEEMWIDGPGSAVNTMSRKWADHLKENKDSFKFGHCGMQFNHSKLVETTTVADLVKLYGAPFFIKIDVEGHELSVLRGMQEPVPFLSFEVNLRAFRREGIRCVEFLGQLKPGGSFNYTADCCAGLALGDWLRVEEFGPVLESCTDETVEVFWKSGCSSIRSQPGR